VSVAPGVLAAALLVAGLAINFLLYLRRAPTPWFLAGDAFALAGAGAAALAALGAARAHAWLALGADALVFLLAAAYPLVWHVRIQVPAGGLRLRPGDALPPHELFDEEGRRIDARTLLGPSGALFVWYRGLH
jgi:hypothetical protein